MSLSHSDAVEIGSPDFSQDIDKVRDLNLLFQLTDSEIVEFFSAFNENYKSEFSTDSIVHLNLLAQEVAIGKLPSEGVFQKFVTMRIAAQKLRSAFMFFDVDHKPPKELHKLVKKMGVLKDAIIAQSGYQKAGRKLDKFLRNLSSYSFEMDFEPTSSIELRKYFHGEASQALEIANSGPLNVRGEVRLSAKKFHDLRKIIRNFLWYVEFMRDDLELKGLKRLRRALNKVNNRMGETHDSLERRSLRGQLMYKSTDVFASAAAVGMAKTLWQISQGENIKLTLAEHGLDQLQ